MEEKRLNELIDFMNKHDLCELEIEEEGKRIKLKKKSEDGPLIIKEKSSQPAQTPAEEQQKQGLLQIKSPMVGTFYRSASPGAKAYVEVGQDINPGDVVCIVEAMKLMNEIKSEISGTIVEIAVENAEPIEFGQILFSVKPHA